MLPSKRDASKRRTQARLVGDPENYPYMVQLPPVVSKAPARSFRPLSGRLRVGIALLLLVGLLGTPQGRDLCARCKELFTRRLGFLQTLI